jgi:hypothetical protein
MPALPAAPMSDAVIERAKLAVPLDGRTRVRRAMGLAAGGTALFGVLVGMNVGGDTAARWVGDVGTFAGALIACLFCIGAARRHGGDLRRLWWLLAAACGAWTVGELIWGLDELILHTDPTPSLADAAYLAAIPLALAGLLSHPVMHVGAARKLRAALDGLVLATSLLFLSWTLVLGSLWRSSDLTTLGGSVNLAYPFGDVVIVFFVVLIARRIDARDRLVLKCLLGGLLAMAVADSAYAYLSQVKGYETGSVVDAGWVAAYLAIALGAYFSRTVEGPRTGAEPAVPTPASFLAPFPPMLAALTVAAIELQIGDGLDRFAWSAALTLVVLVLARQALLIVEVAGPERDRGVPLSSRLLSALTGGAPSSDPPGRLPRSPR